MKFIINNNKFFSLDNKCGVKIDFCRLKDNEDNDLKCIIKRYTSINIEPYLL